MLKMLLYRVFDVVFTWLSVHLGIEGIRQASNWQYRQLEAKLVEIQSQLNAMQVDKLKVFVREQKDKPKPVAVDFETSQVLTMEEFKEN